MFSIDTVHDRGSRRCGLEGEGALTAAQISMVGGVGMSRLALAWINETGLFLALAGGVVTLFVWGLQQPSSEPAVEIDEIRLKRRYWWRTRVGLLLIILGFAVQAFAAWPR